MYVALPLHVGAQAGAGSGVGRVAGNQAQVRGEAMTEQGGTAVNGTGPALGKSKRQLAWERLMLRLLSLEPGMYTISLAIDDKEGYL